MADQQAGEFERKVARLEAIVKELESGTAPLDRAVTLFQEGKALARECETLLKAAQQDIERAMTAGTPGSSDATA